MEMLVLLCLTAFLLWLLGLSLIDNFFDRKEEMIRTLIDEFIEDEDE